MPFWKSANQILERIIGCLRHEIKIDCLENVSLSAPEVSGEDIIVVSVFRRY